MHPLAADQSADDAAHLVASLTDSAKALTYSELQDRLAKVDESMRTLEARRSAAFDSVEATRAELQAMEAKFMMESGGTFNRANLRQWNEALEKALSKSTSLRNEEARLRQLSGVLSRELHTRNSRRDYLIKERLKAKHAPQLAAKLVAARAAIAEVICMFAWNQGGMSPGDILPLRFCAEVLQEHIVREAVSRFAEAEGKQAEGEVKADKMYGKQL